MKNQNSKVWKKNGEIKTDNTEVQKFVRENCEQLYVTKNGQHWRNGKNSYKSITDHNWTSKKQNILTNPSQSWKLKL